MWQCGARGTAQLLRSSKFAGSAECARVRPNCKLNQPVNQPSYPATPKSPLPPLFAFGSSITMRVRYSIHTHTQTETRTRRHSEANKRLHIAIAIARCKWSYALRLWCAAYRAPPLAPCPMTPPLWNTQLNPTQKTQRQRGQHYLSRCGKLIW